MRRYVLTISILIVAIIASNLPLSPEPDLNRKSLKEFPSEIGNWVFLRDQRIDEKAMALLQVDDYIMRTYSNDKGDVISLYIGYFKTQREGKTNHSPRQCLPGAGWSTVETAPVMLQVTDHDPGKIPVNRYLMKKGNDTELFLFWYHGRGRQIASEYLTKVYLIWDSISKNRTDGALIRVNMRVATDPGKTLKIQTEFIRSFYPILSQYVPQ
ncbi:MAG: exosortase C-terminal domain/associated protein EpsI [Syntrophobacteraceae bacterium]